MSQSDYGDMDSSPSISLVTRTPLTGGRTLVTFPDRERWQEVNRGEERQTTPKFTSIPVGEEVHLAELPISHQHRMFTNGR